MAGDWIKMRIDLLDDPSVIQIAQLTKLDRDAILGKLYRLWCWADRHAQDGTVSVMGDWVDEMLGHSGFSDAMRQAGWLEFTSTKMVFPKFERHNGESAKKRIIEAEKKRKQREGTLSPKCPPKKGTLSPKKGDQRREEKRREDTPESNDSGVAADAATAPKAPSKPRDPIWDAVAAECYPSGVPKSQQTKLGSVVRDLKEIGATADEIRRRAELYRKHPTYGGNGCALTATALVSNWDIVATDPTAGVSRPGRVSAPPGKYDRFLPNAVRRPDGADGQASLGRSANGSAVADAPEASGQEQG